MWDTINLQHDFTTVATVSVCCTCERWVRALDVEEEQGVKEASGVTDTEDVSTHRLIDVPGQTGSGR